MAPSYSRSELSCISAQTVAPESFAALVSRLQREKPTFAKRQQDLLAARYDLADRAAPSVTMSRSKPVQDGVRIKLPANVTWERLASMTPEQIKAQNLWPAGFLPLPHPHHEAGGMIFPKTLIDETTRQTERDLTRFDLDFDLPDHLLPEFAASIYLTTRPDLGDVSKGQLVTLNNFNELFKDILIPSNSKDCGCWSRRFPSSSSTPSRIAAPTKEWPASTATPTDTPTPRPTRSATSGRTSTATASTRRRCAVSTSSGCSDRSGR